MNASVARVALVVLCLTASPSWSAVIVVEGGCTLVDAIWAANSDGTVGDCPAGSGGLTIEIDPTIPP